MKDDQSHPTDAARASSAAELRRQAEERLQAREPAPPLDSARGLRQSAADRRETGTPKVGSEASIRSRPKGDGHTKGGQRSVNPQSPIPNPQPTEGRRAHRRWAAKRQSEPRLIHELQVHQIELEMQNEELRQAHLKQETLLARYTDLYDFSPAGYATLDREGTVRQVNLTVAGLLGIDRSRLLKRRFGQFVAESDRRAFSDFLQTVFAGEARKCCEVTLAQEGPNALTVRIEATRCADGQECRAVVLDITESKRAEAERRKLQEQLHQAQKMESVGHLAGGVAHEFNNLLMGIMNYVELCRDGLAPDHPIREWLDEITADSQHSVNLTRQLLAFARKQMIAPKVLDLNDTVASMLKLLRRLIGEDIDLAWMPCVDVWPVKLDPSQIDQILANLAVNARDAIGGVGKLTIQTTNVTLDEAYCAEHVGSVPGDYVLLALSDDGCGMDAETVGHLFEPFFTTKGVGEGTGLGLATVYGIVRQNNGFIDVCSEPGEGTTFRIYLPRFRGATVEEADAETPAALPGGDETVLLVEDEKSIRVTAALFLEALGYTVLTADCPQEALRLAAEHPGRIHLLITDVVMPGQSGHDLAAQLATDRPEMKRLFMSGHTADVIAHRGVLDEGVEFLGKPFTRDELAQKVREVLDA